MELVRTQSSSYKLPEPTPIDRKMSNKGSPSHESTAGSGGSISRISLTTEEPSVLPRDFSLVSITSSASQDEYFKSRDHAAVIMQNLQNYLDNQQLCDVVLIAGMDGKRYAHIILVFLFLVVQQILSKTILC